ncbi:MAG TPA: DMT family transporter [Tepidisphaeraceae bacterium]|nr:DMT family transporter [Tepidisphaeraceae bacterium]
MSERTARLAIVILTLCCVWWGFSFPAMQIGAASVDRVVLNGRQAHQPMRTRLAIRGRYNGWRFGIAGLICLGLAGSGGGRYRRQDVVGGVLIGFFFGAGMLLQICGLQYTLPSVSSFLTALSVVFTPLAQALVFRKPVSGRVWLAVALATAGMIVLSRGNPLANASNTIALIPPVAYLGQAMTILGAMFFTAQILCVDRFGQTADPAKLTAIMLLTSGAMNFLIGTVAGGELLNRVQVIATLGRDFTFLWTFAGLVLLSSVLTMQLMNTWQPRISPATAAVVYCLEPVFGTLFSVAFRTERLTIVTLAGGFMILVAVLTIVRKPEEVHITT